MPRKPNYGLDKRRKELDRKAKKEAKKLDRQQRRDAAVPPHERADESDEAERPLPPAPREET